MTGKELCSSWNALGMPYLTTQRLWKLAFKDANGMTVYAAFSGQLAHAEIQFTEQTYNNAHFATYAQRLQAAHKVELRRAENAETLTINM